MSKGPGDPSETRDVSKGRETAGQEGQGHGWSGGPGLRGRTNRLMNGPTAGMPVPGKDLAGRHLVRLECLETKLPLTPYHSSCSSFSGILGGKLYLLPDGLVLFGQGLRSLCCLALPPQSPGQNALQGVASCFLPLLHTFLHQRPRDDRSVVPSTRETETGMPRSAWHVPCHTGTSDELHRSLREWGIRKLIGLMTRA